MIPQERHELIENVLASFSDEPLEEVLNQHLKNSKWDQKTQEDLFSDILIELTGYGPVDHLMKDDLVTEILVDGYDSIHFEKGGLLQKYSKNFTSSSTFNRFVKTLLTEMDRTADQRHPLVDGSLLNGARIHIALPPVTKNPVISIRKHLKSSWTLNQLTEQGALSCTYSARLRTALIEKKNILICGPTGAGKTTLLRALLSEVCPSERIVIVEDTQELNLKRLNSVSLLTRASLENLFPAIDLNDLLKNALRMRPDRIVVGEIRSEEALVFLDALSTGHEGSMSSIHGNSAAQALGRLEQLVSRAAPQWSGDAIRKLVFEGIDLVVCVGRKNGNRQVCEVAELAGLESFGYLLDLWT